MAKSVISFSKFFVVVATFILKKIFSMEGYFIPKHSLSKIRLTDNLMANEKKYIYGLSGLAELLNCSRITAFRIKKSGKIPFHQVGKKLIFEENAVMASISNQQIMSE